MKILRRRKKLDLTPLLTSQLYDDQTFYPAFLKDLSNCRREVIIESPFITNKRMNALYPSFRRLTKRGVRIVINTRDPNQHEWRMAREAEAVVSTLQDLNVEVLYTEYHHRKLSILDGEIIYEGSLNILSQNDSCEVTRRIESKSLATELMIFLNLNKYMTTKD